MEQVIAFLDIAFWISLLFLVFCLYLYRLAYEEGYVDEHEISPKVVYG